MFNNPEIRAPKPSLAWPGPLVSPDAQTTQLFLKLGQKQAPGGWQRWEGLFSPAWELQNKGQTLGIVSFPRLRERPLSASPGAGSRWIPGGHHGGDITPCSRHLLPPQQRASSICQPVYPAAPGWLQLPSWILHPAHARSGSAPASSYRRLMLGQLSFQHHFLPILRLQEEVVSFSCVKEPEPP